MQPNRATYVPVQTMSKKGSNTTTSPMTWEQFESLSGRLSEAIDHGDLSAIKRVQLSKFLLLINVGSYCGLRIFDILSLTYDDVWGKEELIIEEKKTGKRRMITLNPKLRSIIRKQQQVIKPNNLSEYIFSSYNSGKAWSVQYVNKRIKEIFTEYKVKLKNPSSHTLRKTFGLRVYEMNFKSEDALVTLSHIFNHSSIVITRKYIGLEGRKIENIYRSL